MPRPINLLSAKKVASLKTPGYHADGGGLYLRIRENGTKTWVTIKRQGKSRTERQVAPGDTPLAEARELARRSPEEAKPANEVPTFGDWADTFVDGKEEGWKNEKHRQQWRNTLQTHAKPLRAMRVDAITTDDVLAVLRPIWTKKNETASRLRGRIERILDAAAAKGHRDPDKRNPAAWKGHLEHFLPKKRKSDKGHHAAVPWKDMPDFWAMLGRRRDSVTVLALRFTILTAARTGEVIGATWAEINLADRTWTVPKERMKMGIEHTVPLVPEAVAILEHMGAAGKPPKGFIFPGLRKGNPLSNMAMLRFMKDELGMDETVHGFRSSFRDWAGDGTNFPRDLAEMALAHAVGDATEAAYRRGRAIEKRRPLMEAWTAYLAGGSVEKAQAA